MPKKQNHADEEPSAADLAAEPSIAAKGKYSSIRQNFNEEDLGDPKVARAIIRNVIGENDELRAEVSRLRVTEVNYYLKKEEVAVLSAIIDALRSAVSIKNLMFGLGGIFGGMVFNDNLSQYSFAFAVAALLCFFIGMWDGKLPRSIRKEK